MSRCGEIRQGISGTPVHTQAMDPSPRNLLAADVSANRRARGFTILEVMIALALLATASMTIMSNWAGLHDTRRTIQERQKAQAVLQGVAERLISLEGGALGTKAAPWSQGRFFDRKAKDDSARIGRAPLSETATADADNLVRQGLVANGTGLTGLKIYIEYYRAVRDVSGTANGLLSTKDISSQAAESSEAMRARFADRAIRDAVRIDADSPFSVLPADDPLIIRVLATWRQPGEKVVDSYGGILESDSDSIPDDEDDDPYSSQNDDCDGVPLRNYVQLFMGRRF